MAQFLPANGRQTGARPPAAYPLSNAPAGGGDVNENAVPDVRATAIEEGAPPPRTEGSTELFTGAGTRASPRTEGAGRSRRLALAMGLLDLHDRLDGSLIPQLRSPLGDPIRRSGARQPAG